MTVEQHIVRLLYMLDGTDWRFLLVNSVEDWISLWRRIYAEDREHAEFVDVGGEA